MTRYLSRLQWNGREIRATKFGDGCDLMLSLGVEKRYLRWKGDKYLPDPREDRNSKSV
jgi:hypothetical protein